MRLTKITVYGLFGEYDYEIPLHKGVTFIHSPNGMGKSTVMRLVTDVLSGRFDEVSPVPFERINLDFDDGSRLFVENIGGKLKVQMSRNQLVEVLSPEDLRGVMHCVYLPPERSYVTGPDGNLVSALQSDMKELSASIKTAMADCEIRPVQPSRKLSEGEVDSMIKDCLAKADFMRQAGLAPRFPSGCRFPPSRYEISQNLDLYSSVALGFKEWCERYYRFAESVVVFKDSINSVFVNKTMDLNELGFPQAKMNRSGIIVPLEKFSSGERQVLIMFYNLLFRSEPGSLVVIDEPEVSLHVSWQQQLGRMFGDVARIRELTIIVATHAPAVIHDGWDLAVELCNTRV